MSDQIPVLIDQADVLPPTAFNVDCTGSVPVVGMTSEAVRRFNALNTAALGWRLRALHAEKKVAAVIALVEAHRAGGATSAFIDALIGELSS